MRGFFIPSLFKMTNFLSRLTIKIRLLVAGAMIFAVLIASASVIVACLRDIERGNLVVNTVERSNSALNVVLRGVGETILTDGGSSAALKLTASGITDVDAVLASMSGMVHDEVLAKRVKTVAIPQWEVIREQVQTLLKKKRISVEDDDTMLAFGKILGSSTELAKELDNEELLARQASETATKRAMIVMAAAMIAIFAGVALLGVFFYTGLIRQLRHAVTIVKTVASGNLAQKIHVDSHDEIGQLLQGLKDMNDSLVRMVSQVHIGTETITVASHEIASGNADLSKRTEVQAASLQETVSSMEHLTSTVKHNSDNAIQASRLAVEASEIAERGGNMVGEMIDTMGSIKESSRRIADIIGVIDGIAFQTNILALNAAVEAARAGEQGRGFAVVASEVRNLAQRSAVAAKDIKTLIVDSVGRVNNGSQMVEQAGNTMGQIVTSIKRVTAIMGEITAASNQQSAGIEQINQAISDIDHVTQKNAALVEEVAAAAESLQLQADNLTQTVSVFKLEGVHNTPTHAVALDTMPPRQRIDPKAVAREKRLPQKAPQLRAVGGTSIVTLAGGEGREKF
jgi:methyl-accepting chemotaxis protein